LPRVAKKNMSKQPCATSLSRQGYSIKKDTIDEKGLSKIKKELTVSPFVLEDYSFGPPPEFKLYQEGPTKIYVPRTYGLDRFGVPNVNKLDAGKKINVPFLGSLRREQDAPVAAFMNACRDPAKMGGILNMTCASGKTVMAIYIVTQLSRKAMIIVHKDFLLQQWKERIEQFAPAARIGIIKARQCEVEDKDIVLASLQSLSMKTYSPEIFADFGTVVVDECHHTSAEVFSRALRKVAFRYTLGLSATIKRKDGLAKVFQWYLGNVVYSNVEESSTKRGKKDDITVSRHPKDTVHIHVFKYYENDPMYSTEHTFMMGKLNVARMINQLCEYTPRNLMICNIIKSILSKEPERKILVLSDRKSQLYDIDYKLRQQKIVADGCGFYMGGMGVDDLKQSEGKQILLGTFQMVSEGFDVKSLDTLILASPKSDIIQSAGRILREVPEKRKHIPLIVDIMDTFSLFEKQGWKRLSYYRKSKYEIDYKYVDDNGCVRKNKEGDGGIFINTRKLVDLKGFKISALESEDDLEAAGVIIQK